MIHAYEANMRPKAQATLGRALDFAAYEIGYLPEDFLSLFIESDLAKRFGEGDPSIIMGKSGVELALLAMEKTIGLQRPVRIRFSLERSKEYWIGWALAYYQWETGLSFQTIFNTIPLETIKDMYFVYHELDITHFVEHMNGLYLQHCPHTNLKRMRKQLGLTQEELAEASGVSVRTVQQYEQRRKDINKAQLETAAALAQALHCRPDDLLERIAS